MYVEIDAIMVGEGGNSQDITISRDNISYYRSFITDKKDGKDDAITMVYLKGSIKAIRIKSTHDAFKRKVGSKVLDITGLSEDNIEMLKEIIVGFKNE